MPAFDLSVTICSWNTRDHLRACLAALEVERGTASFEVIVVENNSEDDSGDMVEREFPWVRLLRQTRNLGFTGGHNLAMRERQGKHVFLLNSDAYVHPGCLKTLLECAAAHPEYGVIGPKLLNPDGSLQYSCRRFPNPVAALFRNTLLGRWFPNNRYLREYLMTDFDHSKEATVDWVSGAAMLATDEMIAKVGLMDPEFFMFCEDVDWCFRAWREGFQVAYEPTAVVTHHIGGSTDKVPNRMVYRFHKSMFQFFRKNMVPDMPLLARPAALAFAGAALTARASVFIAKNYAQRWRSRLKR